MGVNAQTILPVRLCKLHTNIRRLHVGACYARTYNAGRKVGTMGETRLVCGAASGIDRVF